MVINLFTEALHWHSKGWMNDLKNSLKMFSNVFYVFQDYLKLLYKSNCHDKTALTLLFSTNVPIMDKPGSWFLLPKCLKKQLWKSDILCKDAGHRHWLKMV